MEQNNAIAPHKAAAAPLQETRSVAEFRLVPAADGKPPKLVGYPVKFNQETVIHTKFGSFREVIRPGAFIRALQEGQDVRADLNHDVNTAFARSSAGTLSLAADEVGLAMSSDLNMDDPDVRKMIAKLANRTWTQMSFVFSVPNSQGERWDNSALKGGGLELREVLDADLFAVSVVTYPAYPTTSVGLRSAADVYREHLDLNQKAGLPAESSVAVSEAGLEAMRLAIEIAKQR